MITRQFAAVLLLVCVFGWQDCLAERPRNARIEAYLAMAERTAP